MTQKTCALTFNLVRKFMACALISAMFCQPAFSEEIKVAGDPWCPYTCDPASEKPGIFIEILKKSVEQEGMTVKYSSLSWSRAVQDARSGVFDGIAGALKSDAPDFIFPQVSFASQQTCFFVKKGSRWKWKGVASLVKVNLGAVNDYTYGEPLDSYIKNSKRGKVDFISGVGTGVRLLRKLVDNRNDVIVEDKNVVTYTLQQNADIPSDEIVNAGCLDSSPLYVAFGPNSPSAKKYAKAVTNGFDRLKRSPQYEEIFKKYGLSIGMK